MYIVKSGKFYVMEYKEGFCLLFNIENNRYPKIFNYPKALEIAQKIKGKVVRLKEEEL